jgi:hypothetical protein
MYATRLCRFCRKSKKTKDLAAAAGFCRDFAGREHRQGLEAK